MEPHGGLNLEMAVLAELRRLRKLEYGLTVTTLAQCPTICMLLGNGDPASAYAVLSAAAIQEDWSKPLEAAFYSLALSSKRPTHLARLEEFAAEWYIDQRHARRYSDDGLIVMAKLIATNWAVSSAPRLNAIVAVHDDRDALAVFLRCEYSSLIRMRRPQVARKINNETARSLDLALDETANDTGSIVLKTRTPMTLPRASEVSLTIIWRGELWPKFATELAQPSIAGNLIIESLGNKLMLRYMNP